jgi:hypothetical protein
LGLKIVFQKNQHGFNQAYSGRNNRKEDDGDPAPKNHDQ